MKEARQPQPLLQSKLIRMIDDEERLAAELADDAERRESLSWNNDLPNA